MDLNTFFGEINSNYNSNNNNNATNANNIPSAVNNNVITQIADDTPAILLEQLAYIDTFMPQIEEDIISTAHNNFTSRNENRRQSLLNNEEDSNILLNPLNDIMASALDDRLAAELKIFADESFIFPDEEKPEYPPTSESGNTNFTPSNNTDNNNSFLNINNNNSDILSNSGNRQQNRKDIRGKSFKTPFGNDDNKAFLKRHNNYNRAGSPLQQELLPLSFDNISENNNFQANINHTSYTPSVHSFNSASATNSIVSIPQRDSTTTQQKILEQISQKPTESLHSLLPPPLQKRYQIILQHIATEKDSNWGNFSNEEAALLLLFKEHYLTQLPVNLLQYDQFQDLSIVETELYKVLGMNTSQKENDASGKQVKVSEEKLGEKRRHSSQEDDLENQVKKLIKISEKLQKKITSLEVENKMLKNLLSKEA